MKTNPNKLVTIFASFTGEVDDSLSQDIENVSASLYRGENFITDLKVEEIEPLNWKVNHIFPKNAVLGDYNAKVEVKVKDQKEPIVQEQQITLVRDLNLTIKTSIDEIPTDPTVLEYPEVPKDIVAHLVNDNDN